jgi:uncharacterized protein (UPF0147 family)
MTPAKEISMKRAKRSMRTVIRYPGAIRPCQEKLIQRLLTQAKRSIVRAEETIRMTEEILAELAARG